MKKKSVLLVGHSGKMGQALQEELKASNDLHLYQGVSRIERSMDFQSINASRVDAVIDFSSPETTLNLAKWCAKHRIPLVIGTTGMTSQQMSQIRRLSKITAIFYSSNMSLGVFLLKRALEVFSGVEGLDFQIIEFHHRRKKDSPSGTALMLQNHLSTIVREPMPQPLSVRGGGIFGIHEVHVMAEDEILKFQHTALHRSAFAKGALLAAKLILKKRAGYYQMEDLL